MFERSGSLVGASGLAEADGQALLTAAGFADWELALVRLREMAVDDESRAALADVLPMLLMALSDAATPDASSNCVASSRSGHAASARATRPVLTPFGADGRCQRAAASAARSTVTHSFISAPAQLSA